MSLAQEIQVRQFVKRLLSPRKTRRCKHEAAGLTDASKVKENSVANFLLVYKGGGMPHRAQSETVMAAWRGWFGSLGKAVVDGGGRFAGSKSVAVGGSVREGTLSGLTGYSILAADSLDAAATLAKGCPILAGGGGIEIYETEVL